MAWIRLDDNFPEHPKIIGLSDSAFRLFISMLCYSNRYLTDGLIPLEIVKRLGASRSLQELEKAYLVNLKEKVAEIRSYAEYQPTKAMVEAKREQTRLRVATWRENQENDGNAVTNELVTLPPNPNPNPTQNNIEIKKQLPRIQSALDAVENINKRLEMARKSGANSWNLSRLVEDEWDVLQACDDFPGCHALTIWYVQELQSRALTRSEIGRIGQMLKRFGRIALLAIDQAASKDLDDLVSYAFRIAQKEYEARKASN